MAQGQSLRARLGAARAAGPGPRQGGPAGLPTSEAQALPAARPARTLWSSLVAQLQPQRARSAPPPCTRARGHGEAGTVARERAELALWVPTNASRHTPTPTQPRPVHSKLSKTQPWVWEAPGTKERKRQER